MSADLLSIAHSGMSSAKKSLQTTSHNISNVNSENYSRQRVMQSASKPIGEGNHVIGTGTYVRTIERLHDDFLEKRINNNLSEHHYNQERFLHLSSLESIFNEINYEGLNSSLNNFYNSFRELANNPASETARSLIRESSRVLINNFHRTREALGQSVTNMNYKIDEYIQEINNITKGIGRLNVKVREMETANGETGDLRDERDLLINKLSEFISVDTFLDDKGRYVVNAKGVGTLVNGNIVQDLRSFSPPRDDIGEDRDFQDAREVFIDTKKISDLVGQGKLSAVFETRNSEIRYLQNKLDDIAWAFANSVNQIHNKGYANKEIDLESKEIIDERRKNDNKVTGIDFFKIPPTTHQASLLIDLGSEVKDDLANIVTAALPNSPADNRIAIAISRLQYENLALEGNKTLEEDYLQSIANVALTVGRFKMNSEQSEGLLAQAKFFKESLSGVSIDEETANMVKYQHAFDASAKVMKVADEMFKTILSIKT